MGGCLLDWIVVRHRARDDVGYTMLFDIVSSIGLSQLIFIEGSGELSLSLL